MTPLLLLTELKKFIEGVVKDYSLETQEKGKRKEPQVVEGYLPPKKATDIPDFPYVIVRLMDGTDTDSEAKVTIRIVFGTYSEEFEGWKDPLNILFRVREKLFTQRVLAKKYRVEYPLKWQSFEDPPYPAWIAEMTTIWTVNRPVEIYAMEDEYYED